MFMSESEIRRAENARRQDVGQAEAKAQDWKLYGIGGIEGHWSRRVNLALEMGLAAFALACISLSGVVFLWVRSVGQ